MPIARTRRARALTLVLLGIGLASSAWAVPLSIAEWVDPLASHRLLAVAGLLGLILAGGARHGAARGGSPP